MNAIFNLYLTIANMILPFVNSVIFTFTEPLSVTISEMPTGFVALLTPLLWPLELLGWLDITLLQVCIGVGIGALTLRALVQFFKQ